MNRRMLRAGAAAAACVLAGTAFAPSAAAHVHVSSPDAVGGGYGKLVFQVPNEEPRADTVALRLHLPRDMPFASVSTMQKPGWTVTTEEAPLPKPVRTDGLDLTKAVSTVTWKARPGQGIPPWSFDEFQLSAGPLPRSGGTLVVPAAQKYSDGSTVNWDRPESNGGEPQNPAPSLSFAEAPADAHGGATPAAAAARASGSGGDVLARMLGVVGVVLGGGALAVAVLTGRRRGPA
ncbi:MAG: YcnI family protein [Streptosporangiales bacterium]|nr:YcnI family protein [Streptosporangiales bacterium]MBO0890362.1 YcnI family protein [Acidothermales bacterium]